MSRIRHRKDGGRTPDKISGNPNVFKEAAERKKGGRVTTKSPGFMTGGAVRPRLDKPGRKSGGRVGADKSPLTGAHNVTSPPKAAD